MKIAQHINTVTLLQHTDLMQKDLNRTDFKLRREQMSSDWNLENLLYLVYSVHTSAHTHTYIQTGRTEKTFTAKSFSSNDHA